MLKYSCNKCDKSHGINECIVYSKTCNNCFKLNYFAVKCRQINKGQLHKIQCDEEKELSYLTLNDIESETHMNWTDIVVLGKN